MSIEIFRIGNFLIARGSNLVVDLAAGKVTGFTFLQLVDGATVLEFDASAFGPAAPVNVPRASTIEWDVKDVQSRAETLNEASIELKVNTDASVGFHWPNPLTPRSAGVYLLLTADRQSAGYRLSFRRNLPKRGHGHVLETAASWTELFLGDNKQIMTLSEWRTAWNAGDAPKVDKTAIQAGALFTGDSSSLIDNEPDGNDWKFVWRFVRASDGVSRAVAIVTIEDEELAVNTRVLRLEERPDLRPRPLRWRHDVMLQCASVREGDFAAKSWVVDWRDVPGAEPDSGRRKDDFSLRSFWQELARHWALGLRSLRARNALTFLPTDIEALDASPWIFRFRCVPDGASWRSVLATIGRPAPAARLRLVLGALLDTGGHACRFESGVTARSGEQPFEALTDVTERGLSSLLDLALLPSAAGLGDFLVGGLVLDAGPLESGQIRIDWVSSQTQLGQPSLGIKVDLQAKGGKPRPGTEDPERGFETENDLLQRERPLVIDLAGATSETTTLRILEEANAGRSRVLEVLVRSAEDAAGTGVTDVVVIDPAPLLIARVTTTGAKSEKGAILAAYRDDGERPPRWELRTDTGAMTLILPPQAIGEEMIKGNLTVMRDQTRVPVPFVDRPFDFRLSPPARLTLDRTDVDTARAAAPWSLRRLLDRREGVVGLKLDAARFELLYGLTTRMKEIEGLRVAEQEAFVGRVPIAPALRDRAQERLTAAVLFPKFERDYARDAVRWIRGLFARPAQLPIFRNFAKRERLLLNDGLTFELRPTRQTAHPLRIDDSSGTDENPLQREPPEDFKRLPLRGGVDYPFESENVYKAVIDREQKGSPGEPQGSVAGVVFGTLGGSGSQQARFDEGRSIIISETTQGRLSSLTVVRIGRIAMLWHHARHVIVYERSTRTVPRYKNQQPADFEGLAALRKVKEYIEITLPRRTYPDFAGGAEERPPAGPLVGCAFETIVIPVKSQWGYDIEEGWVMALRGPMSKEEEPFYPMPKIFLELARAESKGAGAVNHLASKPEQLLFFTTTRPGLGADTDRWPAWPDVDFPLTRKPLPPLVPFLPGFSGASRQPDAARHDYGQARFTIDVVPPEEAVNLMHGRPGKGLEARVSNVSLLRGGAAANVRSAIDDTVGVAFAEGEARISDGLAELAQHLERLADRGDAGAGEVAGLREEARKLLGEVRAQANSVRAAVANADTLLEKGADTWTTIQQRNIENANAAVAKERERLEKQFHEEIEAVVARLKEPTPELETEARARLRSASEAVCRQVVQRMESVPFLGANVLARLDAELARARDEVAGQLERVRQSWRGVVAELALRFDSEGPSAIEAELVAAILDGREQAAAFATGFARLIKNRLGPLFGDIPGGAGAVGLMSAAVDDAMHTLTIGVDETLDIIPPFDIVKPDWKRIAELLDDCFPAVEHLFEGVTHELAKPIRDTVKIWTDTVQEETTKIEAVCTEQTRRLLDEVANGAAALNALRQTLVPEWSAKVGERLIDLSTKAEAQLARLVADIPAAAALQGAINRLQVIDQEIRDKIDKLEASLNDATKSVRELADEASAVAQRASAGLRRIGEQVEQAVTKELRDAVRGVEGAALELARTLAEGPVTDTLRCTRDLLGYYYDTARDALDVTRAAAVFNDLGGSVLNSLAAQVPFDRIRDRILAQLGGFDVNKLFPDYAGLKLEHLLSGLSIPANPGDEYDWIRMRHGFDKDRLTAWSEIVIDKQFDEDAELFALPPVTLLVERPRFSATSRIEADVNGIRAQRTQAMLVADWAVTLNGQPVMTIEAGGLYFDNEGGFRFEFEAQNLQLASALQFITDALRSFLPPTEGLTITPLFPGGISVELSLPLPDIGTGAFTLTGITLFVHFDLLVAGGFEVRTGLWLSRPERPFGMAVLFLGGGGWFGVDVRYKPPQEFETRVSVGLAAGAFVALNFGVARGSAGILLTVGLDFYRNWLQRGAQDLAISIGLLVWGEFSILSIVSAYLRVVMRIEYRNGEMTGYGMVSVSIKICWCFTLRVNSHIRLPFKKKSGASRAAVAARSAAVAVVTPPTVRRAVRAHFANLDVEGMP